MRAYRFLTKDHISETRHKVSRALSKGWEPYGPPSYAFDASLGVMRCGQAAIKDVPGDYSPDVTLGKL